MSENMQAAIANEVNDRISKATQDLADRYATGKGGHDQSVDGPTGSAYRQKESVERRVKNAKAKQAAVENEDQHRELTEEDLDEENEDEDGDYELRQLRDQRLRELRNSQREKIENIGKGHGQYREITQDEFLPEVTGSERVICHFYHREFARCQVIDHHLFKLAQRHIETKFIKINAEKAPFFVQKLAIRTMPTLVLFFDGVGNDKIIGFEGLADGMPEGKEDEWPTIKLARLLGTKGAINKETIVDDEGIEAAAKAKLQEMRKSILSGLQSGAALDNDDDDFNLDD